jgi:hypothetical protein
MEEIGKVLPNYQLKDGTPDQRESLFTVLWSDVGKDFYAKYGRKAFPSNQLVFKQAKLSLAPILSGSLSVGMQKRMKC